MDPQNEFVPFSPSDSEPVYPPIVKDEPEQPEPKTGRQKARAEVMQLHPSQILTNLCTGFKKANMGIVENIRNHYAVPQGTQPDGILSDKYRARMRRVALQTSR